MAKFSPSLMCMNLGDMKNTFEVLDKYVDVYHVDIMDGHFCRNLAFSPMAIQAFRQFTDKDIDVHLMTTKPDDWIEACAKAGATSISPHAETINTDAFRIMHMIRDLGCRFGVVLNPATPLSYVESYLKYVDVLTIMTVDVGFAGQQFIAEMLDKVREAKELREKKGYHYEIQIDGHCNIENYKDLTDAGADILIVGNAGLFGLDKNLDTACQKMEEQYEEAIA